MASSYTPKVRATCVAYGEELRGLFELGRRIVKSGHRPILANTPELVADLVQQTNLEVVAVDAPHQDGGTYIRSMSRRLLGLAPSSRVVFLAPDDLDPEQDVVQSDVTYLVSRDAPPQRLKAVIDMATFSDGLTGSVSRIDLIDFLQLVLMKRDTCAVSVRGAATNGSIVVEAGDIVDAHCGDLRGNDAVVDILCQSRGQFSEADVPTEIERTVVGCTNALLLEAMRVRDERTRDAAGASTPENALEMLDDGSPWKDLGS